VGRGRWPLGGPIRSYSGTEVATNPLDAAS
jgi:hypothetical protein